MKTNTVKPVYFMGRCIFHILFDLLCLKLSFLWKILVLKGNDPTLRKFDLLTIYV